MLLARLMSLLAVLASLCTSSLVVFAGLLVLEERCDQIAFGRVSLNEVVYGCLER